MVRQLGDSEDVDEVEEELEERRALLALPTSANDRKLRDDRACSGRHAASIGEPSRMARGLRSTLRSVDGGGGNTGHVVLTALAGAGRGLRASDGQRSG